MGWSTGLGGYIMRFFEKNFQHRHGVIKEADIQTLKELSPSFIARLHVEIYLPTLSSSLYFCEFITSEREIFKELCNAAVSETYYMPHQNVSEHM